MYGECISCTLHPALYEGLARWDLMLTDNLFIASHEPWHNSGLDSIHHFQAQPGSLPQARASTPRRRTKAGDGACEQTWFNCTGYTKGRCKKYMRLIVTGSWNCTSRPHSPQDIQRPSSRFTACIVRFSNLRL